MTQSYKEIYCLVPQTRGSKVNKVVWGHVQGLRSGLPTLHWSLQYQLHPHKITEMVCFRNRIAISQCFFQTYFLSMGGGGSGQFKIEKQNNQDPRLGRTPQYHLKGNLFSWYVNLTSSNEVRFTYHENKLPFKWYWGVLPNLGSWLFCFSILIWPEPPPPILNK